MKTLSFTIILCFIFSLSFGQSFYHKKMKKVKSLNINNCAAMKPDRTFKHRHTQKNGYATIRRKNKYR